jgi:hypothetical protein
VRFDAYPGETFDARVAEIGAAAHPVTGTYEVELAIDARGRALASGLVGRADIAVAAAGAVRLVPVEAVVEADGDSGSVYVVRGTGAAARARRVAVSIAFVRGAHAAVRAGLDDVAEVITDGAPYLSDGARVVVAGRAPGASGRLATRDSQLEPAGAVARRETRDASRSAARTTDPRPRQDRVGAP